MPALSGLRQAIRKAFGLVRIPPVNFRTLELPKFRTSRRTPCGPGFTLIEMLVVIGIISVLLGLLYSALERTRKFSRYTITYNEIKQIQAAFEQYYAHYQAWPTNEVITTRFQSEDGEDWGFIIDRDISDTLQGLPKNQALFEAVNPDGLPFIEFTRYDKRAPYDPVNPFKANKEDDQRRYAVLFDTSGNRQIAVPADSNLPDATSTTVVANVAVWTIIPGAHRPVTGDGEAPKPASDFRLGSWEPFDLQK